jgi:hypothetical protein
MIVYSRGNRNESGRAPCRVDIVFHPQYKAAFRASISGLSPKLVPNTCIPNYNSPKALGTVRSGCSQLCKKGIQTVHDRSTIFILDGEVGFVPA